MRVLLASLVLAVLVLSPARAEEADRLQCPDTFTHPEQEPLLLVHGTFTNARENWGWNWQLAHADDMDVCTVTLPDRSLGDMQVQGELVAQAIREMADRSGGQVDVMGHSQGGLHPRWAVKWWPEVRTLVDDLVMLGAPNHGTEASAIAPPVGCFASCWQMGPDSAYIGALNRDDETPGDISYTSIYTLFDELVLPQVPESTSALEPADNLTNIAVQDVCPGRPVEHAGLMADLAAHEIAMDALVHPGSADVTRINPLVACAGVFFDGVDPVGQWPDIMRADFDDGFPDFHNEPTEPELRDYATS